MPRLGPGLWDDQGFVIATLLPRGQAIDLGSATSPFRNLYLSGDFTVLGSVLADGDIDLLYTKKLKAYNVAGATLLDLIYNGAGDKAHVNGLTEIDLDIASVNQASLTAAAFTLPNASIVLTLGGITLSASGKTLTLKATGAAAKAGTVIVNGTTPVTVATTGFVAGSTVVFSLKTIGGTVGAIPRIGTPTAGTSFTVVATASDTSTYNWVIIDQA